MSEHIDVDGDAAACARIVEDGRQLLTVRRPATATSVGNRWTDAVSAGPQTVRAHDESDIGVQHPPYERQYLPLVINEGSGSVSSRNQLSSASFHHAMVHFPRIRAFGRCAAVKILRVLPCVGS
jgi:hypothetical protein